MLLKRILIGALSAVIIGGAAFYGVNYRFFDKPLTVKEQEAFEEKINLPDGFILAASADASDALRNSMESVKSGVASSSYAIELNVAFDEEGAPYLAENSAYITKNSVLLETVFQKYAKQKYLRYILHMNQIIRCDTLYNIASEYNCADRIILTGVSREDMMEHGDYFSTFPVAVDLDSTYKNLNRPEDCFELAVDYQSLGATMILASPDQITDELVSNTSTSGMMPLAIRNVFSEYDMYKALSIRPAMIITSEPDKLYEIMRNGDYMGFQH